MSRLRKGYSHINDSHNQKLVSEHSEHVVHVHGFEESCKRSAVFHLFSLLLLGSPYLIVCWFPQWKTVKYKSCPLKRAQFVLVSNEHGDHEILHVETDETHIPHLGLCTYNYFSYQHTKYVLLKHNDQFVPLNRLITPCTLDEILEESNGLMSYERKHLLDLFGSNTIDIVIKSYWQLFVEEVLNPFYVFQGFSITLWCFDDYSTYAVCIFIVTLLSIITTLIQTRRQNVAIHNLAASATAQEVQVLHPKLISGHSQLPMDSKLLAPGDLLVIPATGCIMTCDAVLISGNCIVNESMLTGESVPITKTPPHSSSEYYTPDHHKRHTLFSGTHILQARYYNDELVVAKVVRTGFDTSKGALIKSILFPTPVGLKFYSDSLKFIFFLAIIAFAGMSYCVYLYVRRDANVEEIILRTLDIITIVVPPALPAAMNLGIVNSCNRLKKLKIFCISPMRISVCGKLKLACFDKTGTLTHDGLELYSVIPCSNLQFGNPVIDVSTIDEKSPLIQAMGTCHSLTRIDGTLSGDPLDLILFESIEWDLEEPTVNETALYDMLAPVVVKPQETLKLDKNVVDDIQLPYEIGIIRQFPFSSSQQCMSVICRVLGDNHFTVFTKGAPEKITSLCLKETIPQGFDKSLVEFAGQGFRVIALAYKNMPRDVKWIDTQKIKRDLIERDLTFLGLVLLQNTLKPETIPAIATLQNANIRTVMITGDNIRTAISVARDCGMINGLEEVIIIRVDETEEEEYEPKIVLENLGAVSSCNGSIINLDGSNFHFALDGKVWSKLRLHYPDLIPTILLRGTVFARFQPDQKAQLIAQFQKLDYIVSMVGDGANDCGALKAAHVGISLSQAEASVAAPFTSSIPNISCLIHLILEGRCALVTSFAVFKYMALYSLIQFFTVLLLYTNHSTLGDQQYLFIDLIVISTLAVTLSSQGPYNELVPSRPMGTLMSARNLIPLLLQIFLCATIQISALFYLTRQSWYRPLPPGKEEVVTCWENLVLFLVSCYQYSILALVYSKGEPFRESILTNVGLLISVLCLTSFEIVLMVWPIKPLDEFFEIYEHSDHPKEQSFFKLTLLAFPTVHFFLAMLIENCIADRKWFKKTMHCLLRKKQPRNKYKLLLQKTNFSDLFNILT